MAPMGQAASQPPQLQHFPASITLASRCSNPSFSLLNGLTFNQSAVVQTKKDVGLLKPDRHTELGEIGLVELPYFWFNMHFTGN